jgi:hypothetical protein
VVDDDRRSGAGFAWDPERGALTVGERTAIVGEPASGAVDNQSLLRTYLELVGHQRGERPTVLGGLRDADIDALARVLDLDDAGLEVLLSQLLGVSTGTARRVRVRLRARARRLVIAGAAVGLGVGAVASVPAAAGPSAPAPVHAAAPRSLRAAGVEEQAPVADAPPAAAPAAPAAAPAASAPVATTPAPDDDTDIGTATKVEKLEDGSLLVTTESAPAPPAPDGTDVGTALTIEHLPPPAG